MENVNAISRLSTALTDFMLMAAKYAFEKDISVKESFDHFRRLNDSFDAIFKIPEIEKTDLEDHLELGISLTLQDMTDSLGKNSGWVAEWSRKLIRILLELEVEDFMLIPMN